MKFTLRSVDRETGGMTPMMRGSRSSVSGQAAVASNACRLCDFAVTKSVPAKRLYGDIEPGLHHIITLERWSKGGLIYRKEKPNGRPEDR